MTKRFHWQKRGLIFSPQSLENRPSWMDQFAQAPATLILDDVVRVFFSTRSPPDPNGQFTSLPAYVDLDRANLTRIVSVCDQPLMSLGERGHFDEFGIYPFSVLQQGSELHAFYGGWTRCQSVPFNVAIGQAISTDQGAHFKRCYAGPILSYTPDEPFILSGPKIRFFSGQFVLTYIAGKKWIIDQGRPEPVYRIRLATSKDGHIWIKHHQDLIAPRIEEDECQASPDIIHHNDQYHMFFCYRASRNYRGKEGGYRIGYAVSNDLIQWSRDDTAAGLDISDRGFDDEMIAYPHVFTCDGKIYMLYLGNQVGRAGFGLAECVKGF
jgi:hypothetical protein